MESSRYLIHLLRETDLVQHEDADVVGVGLEEGRQALGVHGQAAQHSLDAWVVGRQGPGVWT